MKKGKWLIGLCMAATFAFCGLFAACGGNETDPNPDTGDSGNTGGTGDSGGGQVTEVWDLKLNGEKTRELEIDKTMTDPVTDTLTWTVTKNGETVTTEPVTVEITGDAIEYNKTTHIVTAVKVGTATATITLTGHSDVPSLSVTYEVVDYFFSRDVQRGTLNLSGESNGQVQIMGGQATLVAESKATAWLFRAKLKPIDYTSTEAFGVGSFLDNGDHALWFGLQNEDGQADGKFSVYRKDFYAGWGNGSEGIPEGYHSRGFDLQKGIDCEIIRDGNKYYYCIDTFYGEYTAEEVGETYPGIFSQERIVAVSDFSVSYDAEEIAEAAAAYADKGVASIVINETNKTRLLKGSSQDYTATSYPAGNAGTISWSLDKSGMTAGQDGTTVSEQGKLQLANDAAGTVVLICEAGTARDTLTITVISEVDDKENDRLSVMGGALLEDSGDVVFPEYMMGTDGVGNEESYTEEPGYGAILKQKVRGNFSVQFTVSEYKENATYPKLMISLGGTHNQFYIVYNDNATFRIETFTEHIYNNAVHSNDWVNSDNFANFDASKPHTFKIEVRGGIYNVTVDGGDPLVFKTNSGAHESTLVRKFEDCNRELPIRISTKGVSARVSNIVVTQNETAMPEYFGYGNVLAAENGFGMQFYAQDEEAGWAQAHNRVVRTAENRTDNFILTMNLTFSAAMTDGKAILNLGNKELHFCNKIASGELYLELLTINNGNYDWGNKADYSIPYEAGENGTYAIALRIERKDGTLRIIANGKELCQTECTLGSNLMFSVFNATAADDACTVTFTDIVFGDYEESKVYSIEDLTKSYTLSVKGTQEIGYTVSCNNNPVTEGFEAEVATEDKGFISYDAASKKVTALKVGQEMLTITIKVEGKVVCTASVEFTVTARETLTENEDWQVKGGVVLYKDDNSIEFPVSMQNTDGVGSQEAYADNAYSANYKTTVSGDFSIEFTVENYQTKAQYPKLMISLGGTHNQFYVVYNREGSISRIESFTESLSGTSLFNGGGWINSETFVNFNTNTSHTFKIEVKGGIYTVSVDGKAVTFHEGEKAEDVRTPVRKFADYSTEQPIRISTSGVSCTVRDIKVTKNATTMPEYFGYGNVQTAENGFGMKFAASPANVDAWAQAYNRVVRTAENRTGNFTLTMNLTFSAAMTDSKAIVLLGTAQELQFCNKIAANEGIKLQLCDRSLSAPFGATYAVPYKTVNDTYVLEVRIERSGNTNRIIVNGEEICTTEYAIGAHLQFSVFNTNAAEAESTVTFTDIAFADYEESKIYSIEGLTKSVTLSVRGQHNVSFTVNCNNNPLQEGYTVEVTTEDDEFISYDDESKKVTALQEGEATLTITVKVDGKVVCTETVTFHITARETLTENEDWQVKGGVVLYKDDNSIEFPESMQGTNGVGPESAEWNYADNDYSANYKKTVTGDFSIEFTVENYKTNVAYPKLMVSLGGTHNQFYVVYNRTGTINRIESFTESISGKAWYDGAWINSAEFEEGFDVNASHTYKIEVKSGIYSVSVDGKTVTFHEGENAEFARTPVRKLADYSTEQPIRISTNGVSCTVRDIKVETTQTAIPDYFGYEGKAMAEENGFSMQFFAENSWDQARNRVVRKEPIPEGSFTLTMNLTFSAAMTDGKAIVNLGGSKEFHFCNKIETGQLYLELVTLNGEYVNWPAEGDYNIPYEAGEDGTYTVALRIERSGNMNRIIANGVELCKPEYEIGSYLRFSVFNEKAEDAEATVKFTDITFGEYEEFAIYTIENLSKDVTLTLGKEQELAYNVCLNGNPVQEGYTVDVTTEEEKEFVSYEGGKLKALAIGEENVTITVKVGEKVVCTAVVKVTVIARPTAESNENWQVKGGVVLYTDDNSIEFPEAYQGTNGLGSETDYATSDYSADYKHTVIGNFSIKFTVSNYKTTAQYPKLMISLGGSNEQFYVVYKRLGTINHIETYTRSIDAGGNMCGGQWVNSAEFAEFDTDIPHTFEIKVVSGGLYEVYLDNTKLEGFNMDGAARTIFRRYEDYTTEQPIRISTNGVSCTVSDIVVTNGSAEDVKTSGTKNANWFTHSDKHISAITDNGFTMAMQNFGWGANDDYANRIFRLAPLADTYTIEFNLVFSASMTDAKFVVRMDDLAVMINNKPGAFSCNINGVGADWQDTTIANEGLSMKVKIVKTADKIAVYFNDADAATKEYDTGSKPRTLSFYAFNENAGEAAVTATVSNLTVS